MACILTFGPRPRWLALILPGVAAAAVAFLGAGALRAADEDRPAPPGPQDPAVPGIATPAEPPAGNLPAETPPAETPPAETPPAETPPAETPPAGSPRSVLAQTSFPTAEAAAKAMFDAFARNDDAALRAIVGPGSDDLVQDGKDPVVRAQRAELASAAATKLALERQPDGHVLLVVGSMAYPLALPLIERDGAWRVDAAAGRKELLVRRIGVNELEAVGICLAYPDAQVAYATKDRDGDGVKEYAQRLMSTPGTKDGLSWESEANEEQSPAGPNLTPLSDAPSADATVRAPFGGYYWRVLTAQGANAPGGAFSSVINGNMIAGFALIAAPAVYRNTGVMTFITSHHGKIYEKDLGPDTLRVAAALMTFDPDTSWREVDEATLRAAALPSPEDAPYAASDIGLDSPSIGEDPGVDGPAQASDALPAGSDAERAKVPPAPPIPCPVR